MIAFCGDGLSKAYGFRFCVPLVPVGAYGFRFCVPWVLLCPFWFCGLVVALALAAVWAMVLKDCGGRRSPWSWLIGDLSLAIPSSGHFGWHKHCFRFEFVNWGPSSKVAVPCARRSGLWARLIWCWFLLRIGEAAVPGPEQQSGDTATFSIGVTNPNGLQDKACYFVDSAVDCWCVSETHLTQGGVRCFQQQLRRFGSAYAYSSFGHPVLPRTEVSDVGRWSGVGLLSKWPTCRLPHDWSYDLYVTGRLHVTSSFVSGQWISGCVVYGTPCGPTHPSARKTTEGLLNAAVLRILQLSGPRFIAGDFNHDHDSFPDLPIDPCFIRP